MADKTPSQPYSTPPGELGWIFITDPGTDNFNKDGKVFKGSVILAGEAKDQVIADVKAFFDENKIKGKKAATMGYSHPPLTDDEGNKIPSLDEDGEPIIDNEGNPVYKKNKDLISITMNTNTTWPDGKPNRMKVFNAKGNEVSIGDKKIGNGSKGCLVGKMSMYERPTSQGVTFYLTGIQLIKFLEYEGGEAELESYEEEGGFEGFDETSGIEMEASKEEPKEEKKTAKKAKPRL